MLESLNEVQTVQIGTEFYRLVEVKGEFPRLAWEETFEDEDAWQGGVPNILSDPTDTWHLGGFKSREGIPGTSEYGQNTDGRWPNRLIPGPEVGSINTGTTARWFFEAMGYLWAVSASTVKRIDPADDSVVESKVFDPYVISDAVAWEGDDGFVASNDKIWKVSAVGTPDTWTQGDHDVERLAVGADRMFGTYEGVLKNVRSGNDPLLTAQWADRVECGDVDASANSLTAFGKSVLVGKPEGLFGIGDEGKGVPLLKRMGRHALNCLGMDVVDPYVFVPHAGGVYRYIPGYAEEVGLKREILNETPLKGVLRSFAADGQWIFTCWAQATTYGYLMVGRDAKEGEASLGPIIWDTLSYYVPGNVLADSPIMVSHLWSPPRLFFARFAGVGYIKIPELESSDYRFVTSGFRYTHRYHFGVWRDKDFLKVDAVGKDCDATTYWEISYSVDGGAYSNLDVDGTAMRVDSDGLHTFILPSTAKGREVQFKLTYTGAASTTGGKLVHFRPYAVPCGLKLRHYQAILYLAEGTRHDGGVEQRTSVDQLNDLNALTEDATAVDFKGPWGDIKSHPKKVRVLEARQEGHGPPRFLVELVAQKREEA
jgi:hypothetical protein